MWVIKQSVGPLLGGGGLPNLVSDLPPLKPLNRNSPGLHLLRKVFKNLQVSFATISMTQNFETKQLLSTSTVVVKGHFIPHVRPAAT